MILSAAPAVKSVQYKQQFLQGLLRLAVWRYQVKLGGIDKIESFLFNIQRGTIVKPHTCLLLASTCVFGNQITRGHAAPSTCANVSVFRAEEL